MTNHCIDSIDATPRSQAGWEYLYRILAPTFVEHVEGCRACQDRLAELLDEEPLDFMTWNFPESSAAEGRRVMARMIRRGEKELQMLIEICAWVWKRDGHIGTTRTGHAAGRTAPGEATVLSLRSR